MTKLANLLSEIKQVKVSSLFENPLNPHRVEKDKDYDETMRSIEKEGVIEPLIAKRDGMLLSGHKRLSIAKILRLKKVPVRYCEREFETIDEEKKTIMLFNVFRREYGIKERIEAYVEIFGKHDVYEKIKNLPLIGEARRGSKSRTSYFADELGIGKGGIQQDLIASVLAHIFEGMDDPIESLKNRIRAKEKAISIKEYRLKQQTNYFVKELEKRKNELSQMKAELEKLEKGKNNSRTKAKV